MLCNLIGVWEKQWAFVQQSAGAPLIVGEMGGWYTGKDQQWQDWALKYIREHSMGVFYFALKYASPLLRRLSCSTPWRGRPARHRLVSTRIMYHLTTSSPPHAPEV